MPLCTNRDHPRLFSNHGLMQQPIGGSRFTFNKVLGIYLPTMEIAFHEILRLPQEAVRGPFPNRDEQTLYFDMRQWYAQDA